MAFHPAYTCLGGWALREAIDGASINELEDGVHGGILEQRLQSSLGGASNSLGLETPGAPRPS